MRVLGEICLLVSLVSTGYAAFLCVMPGSNERRLRQRVAVAASIIGLTALTFAIVVLALAHPLARFSFRVRGSICKPAIAVAILLVGTLGRSGRIVAAVGMDDGRNGSAFAYYGRGVR